MNEQVTNYVNGVFAPYEGVKSVADLQERFRELKAEGKDYSALKGLGADVSNVTVL